ncbi:MAG TPA: NADH-quinone oxidoreductase subunit J [Verrucomicrobiales bacterium]|nr:NADH-quinone oxidoreductase subunit J [Verrucomicrobiales bacterium]
MPTLLFYLFALIALLFGAGVIVNRNPVSSALCLVMSFVGLAALFIQLDAFLIGIVQILVYAGAVMVLFLFIIMLLDLRSEKRRRINRLAWIGGAGVTAAFVFLLLAALQNFQGERFPALRPDIAATLRAENLPADAASTDSALIALTAGRLPDVHLTGEVLFTRFVLPLQIVGALLLVATVGVVVLSKRRLT